MNWKFLSFILIIIIIICFIHNYSSCVYNTKPLNEFVIHYGINMNWLNENIEIVYKLISPIAEQLRIILPVTNRISHWMLGFKLSNDEYIICSSSPFGYIELYKVDDHNNNRFVRNDKKWVAYVRALYINIKQYKVSEFLKTYMNYYISFNGYYFFDENCQKMTSYALHNIFGVNDKETQRETYDISVIPEYLKSMKNKCFGNVYQ